MNTPRAMRSLRELARDDRGTTAIEYSIIAAGISVAIIGAVTSVGSEIMVVFYDKLTNLF
jgi:pilus assembly protein Flp/PilA